MNKLEQIRILKNYVSNQQLNVIVDGLRNSEEKEYFADLLTRTIQTINTMPKSYETDGQGDRAIAHLHYFVGGCDWYITEKDMQHEQTQAYGLASLGYYPETGYISIKELTENNVELDLHWTPLCLGEIKTKLAQTA